MTRACPSSSPPRSATCRWTSTSSSVAAQEPDRSKLREFFREFELRDPLRRLEEALGGEEAAAPRQRAVERAAGHGASRSPPSDLGTAGRRARHARGRAPAGRGRRPSAGRCASPHTRAASEVMVGEAETLAALTLAWGERPLVAHDWKSLAIGRGPVRHAAARARHDGGRLPDRPRAAQVPAAGAARGRGHQRGDRRRQRPRRARRVHARACGAPARGDRGAGPHAAPARGRDAARGGADRHGARGRQARHRAPRRDQRGLRRAHRGGSSARSGSWRARSSRSARRSSSAHVLFEKLEPVEEAPRQDRLLNRRARARRHPRRAPDRREGGAVARAHQAQEHLPRRATRADQRRGRAPAHHLQPDGHHHRPPVEHQPQPPEHPDPSARRAARSAPASWRRRAAS